MRRRSAAARKRRQDNVAASSAMVFKYVAESCGREHGQCGPFQECYNDPEEARSPARSHLVSEETSTGERQEGPCCQTQCAAKSSHQSQIEGGSFILQPENSSVLDAIPGEDATTASCSSNLKKQQE